MLRAFLAMQLAVPAELPPPVAEAMPATTPAPEPAPAAAPPEPTPAEDFDVIPAVPGERDPLQPINRVFYAITQPIDQVLIRPVAMAYQAAVPRPLRDGARNGLQNLSEPVVAINDLLQARPDRAVKTLARFVINSTFGFLGLFDVAKRKPFHIAHHDNGFGDTLGVWGMGPLVYFYLPVLGPMTLRDFAGQTADDFAQPRLLHKITHPNSHDGLWSTAAGTETADVIALAVEGIDERAENDQELKAIRNDSVDPYAALRTSFLQDRAGEIAALKAKDGEGANPHLDDPLEDPAAKK